MGYIEEGNENMIVIRVNLPDSMKMINEEKWNLFTTTKKWYAQLFCSLVSLER